MLYLKLTFLINYLCCLNEADAKPDPAQFKQSQEREMKVQSKTIQNKIFKKKSISKETKFGMRVGGSIKDS